MKIKKPGKQYLVVYTILSVLAVILIAGSVLWGFFTLHFLSSGISVKVPGAEIFRRLSSENPVRNFCILFILIALTIITVKLKNILRKKYSGEIDFYIFGKY